jgi:CRP-like cAMP-binding protein
MTDAASPLNMLAQILEDRATLSTVDRDAILNLACRATHHEPREYLLREGKVADRCMMLVEGFAFSQVITGAGARQIVALHVAGDFIGIQDLFSAGGDRGVQVLTEAKVISVSKLEFGAIAKSVPAIGHAVFLQMAKDMSIYREWIVNIGRRDARSRVAHLICEIAVRLDAENGPAGQDYDLPMSQEQIGDALGLTSVHVNRTLGLLEKDGLIRRDKRRMHIPHWKRLCRVSGFSSHYIDRAPISLNSRGRSAWNEIAA